MKVLFLHAALNGLSAEYRVHATLAANAPENSIDPLFVWQGPRFVSDAVPEDRVRYYDFGRDMSATPRPNRVQRALLMGRNLPGAIHYLSNLMRSTKPDIIYTSQQRSDIFLAQIMSYLFKVPHVIHIHYNVGPWLGRSALRAIVKGQHLIAVSEYIRQTALLAGATENVHTIVNPTPMFDHETIVDRNTLRAALGYDKDTPLVLSVGRLDPGKGHIALFEAFALVVKEMPTARLLVCGSSTSPGGYEAALRQKLAELNLEGMVTLAGQRSDVRSLMRCADVFCLPTQLDPCPLVFLEASAEGLPSVAYLSGGVPELVFSERTGLLSYPRDINALSTNLIRVLSNGEFAKSLGAAAKDAASGIFHPKRSAERWVEVLKSISGEAGSHR